eukprot:GHVP01068206.1.p1 GENE.GHVP01068206.1~~GHVP01068206.1.p1  ORF type:complete len:100 (-),score=5.70 GHVP01068206.1:151-450(-)
MFMCCFFGTFTGYNKFFKTFIKLNLGPEQRTDLREHFLFSCVILIDPGRMLQLWQNGLSCKINKRLTCRLFLRNAAAEDFFEKGSPTVVSEMHPTDYFI